MGASHIARLEWDSAHFGVPMARLEGGTEGLPEALSEARRAGIRCVVARLGAEDIGQIQCLERWGFRLMDTLVCYERALPAAPVDPPAGLLLRVAASADAGAVERLAQEAFAGYAGHFRHDPRLDPALADKVYVSWAVNACRRAGRGEGMLIAEEGGRPVGFGLVTLVGGDTAEGALYAVAPSEGGRGIGGALTLATMAWASAGGGRRFTVYSSVANPRAHRVWLKAGSWPSGALHTLHLWLGETRGWNEWIKWTKRK